MRLSLSLGICAATLFACGNGKTEFNPDDSGADTGADPDAYVPPIITGDGGVDDVSDAPVETEPASSLTLEQVWFVTGQQTTSDFLIDFRKPTPVVTCGGSVGVADGFEGTGVFTDPKNGDLLFYTDGRTVFNGKTNQLLTNGSGLLGDQSATEPALITPSNSNKDVYYLFTNNTNVSNPSSVYYSVLDLSKGANGTVTTQNTVLLNNGNPGEALDVLPHSNKKDFWVLIYDGAGTMKAFLVDATGVKTTPVVSSLAPLTGVVKRSAINHTLSYDSLVLAQNYGGASGSISTASFDRATGKVSGVKTVATGDLGYHASYSADGNKLYYVRGTEGWSGVAYQYDLLASKETMLGGTGMAAAKLAPDGKVYWAAYGHSFMGVVNKPDVSGTGCNFVENGLDLNGCKVAFGVPNQTASYIDYLPPVPIPPK